MRLSPPLFPRRAWRARVALVALALGVSGCANFAGIGPKAQLATPQTLGMATVVAAPALPKSAATPRTAWWSAFGDAQLNALVQQASMLAVNDIFMGSATIFMLLIPSLWFAKRVGMVSPAAPAAQGAKVGAH